MDGGNVIILLSLGLIKNLKEKSAFLKKDNNK